MSIKLIKLVVYMSKKISSGVLGLLLFATPLISFAETSVSVQMQTDALLKQITQLQTQIAALRAQSTTPKVGISTCLNLNNALVIGSVDAATNGEVSKLQNFLIAAGMYPEARITGYYGTLTAQAVVRWQKAHGMDFVTLTSGVGPMTRGKLREACSTSNNNFSELEILANLKTNWQAAQTSIAFRPAYHNQTEDAKKIWRLPSAVQFIGKNSIIVRFEDDTNVHVAVLNFDGGKFNLLETLRNKNDFTFSGWQNLVNTYGSPSYTVSTYATNLVKNGQIVNFLDLTKVSENIFVKEYWQDTSISTESLPTLEVAPLTGAAPLTVTATLGNAGFFYCASFVLTWGDGTNNNYSGSDGSGVLCPPGGVPQVQKTHVYTSPGTYTVTFQLQGKVAVSKTVIVGSLGE